MNWEVVTNDRSSLQEYRLIDHNECKVIVKYNPLHRSARITSGTHHRLFYLESAGSLSGKTIFKNEYGMETGNLVHDKFHPQEGSVVIDNKKYKYLLQTNSLPEMIIYENDHQQPIATCTLDTPSPNNNYSVNTSAIDNNCFLLGLCWYLFLPEVKQDHLQLDPVNH